MLLVDYVLRNDTKSEGANDNCGVDTAAVSGAK
jgi:hypothetical protein